MTRYLYTDSELPITPAPPLEIEENSDSWWAGVQRCFVAVPIAGTLAAVALSASLSWGYQQQTEDIVEQPAAFVEDEYWQVYTPPYPRSLALYLPDPEELPAGALFGQPDEDYWWVPTPRTVGLSPWIWAVEDDLPIAPEVFAPDEDYWINPPAWPKPHQLLPYLPDPEEIPAGSLFGTAEEDYWHVYTPPPPTSRLWVAVVDDEIVPQPPPAPAVEEMILFRVGPIWIRIG